MNEAKINSVKEKIERNPRLIANILNHYYIDGNPWVYENTIKCATVYWLKRALGGALEYKTDYTFMGNYNLIEELFIELNNVPPDTTIEEICSVNS